MLERQKSHYLPTTNEDFHTNTRYFYFGGPNPLFFYGSLSSKHGFILASLLTC